MGNGDGGKTGDGDNAGQPPKAGYLGAATIIGNMPRQPWAGLTKRAILLKSGQRGRQGGGKVSLDPEPYIGIIREWWDSLTPRSRRTRGNIAGGLVILENLRSEFTLDLERHKAAGSDQLRNATGPNVRNILTRFGESRLLLREGGRTNRGLMHNLAPLLAGLAGSGLAQLGAEERIAAIDAMQAFLVERARDLFNADWISFDYSSGASSREIVGKILSAASDRHKAGEVAEYLVGAKLALRFPAYAIRNSAASAADLQTEEQGIFR